MDDVRLYIRDALKEYARLQTFAPRPSWNAVCYTGDELLAQFGLPYAGDREVCAAAEAQSCIMPKTQLCKRCTSIAWARQLPSAALHVWLESGSCGAALQ